MRTHRRPQLKMVPGRQRQLVAAVRWSDDAARHTPGGTCGRSQLGANVHRGPCMSRDLCTARWTWCACAAIFTAQQSACAAIYTVSVACLCPRSTPVGGVPVPAGAWWWRCRDLHPPLLGGVPVSCVPRSRDHTPESHRSAVGAGGPRSIEGIVSQPSCPS